MYGPYMYEDGEYKFADDEAVYFLVTRDTDYPTFNVTEHVRPMFEVIHDHDPAGCGVCVSAYKKGELIVVD